MQTSTPNRLLLNRSLAAVWHPCTQMKQHESLPLIPVARAHGCWLYDFEGRRYLDAVSSWWVNLFGHANPRINAALHEQLETLEHVILAGCTHAPVVELSERLSALTGGRLGHCFYGSDGASAVEKRPRKRRAVAIACRPATPTPMMKTFAAGTVPAAVIIIGMPRP